MSLFTQFSAKETTKNLRGKIYQCEKEKLLLFLIIVLILKEN